MTTEELRSVIELAKGLYPNSGDVQFAAFGRRIAGEDMQTVWDVLLDSHKHVHGTAFANWEAIYDAIEARKPKSSLPRYNPHTGEILADNVKPARGKVRMIDVIRAGDPQCYPDSRHDVECICHYYAMGWDDLRKREDLTAFQKACGRKSMFLSVQAALLDVGIKREQADGMAKEAVGLKPDDRLPDPWAVRDMEAAHV